ncbi:MAG: ABC transporter permease subunit [Gemmatimonadetes bacterium]|nr:ABC transporter permease subunit [Gemmatimonadota bacterium]
MTRTRRTLLAGAAWAATAWGPLAAQDVPPTIVVASKSFTEGVILGELGAGVIEDARYAVRRRRELGGTRVLFNALVSGAIDVYGEYTGTIVEEILADLSLESEADLRAALLERGVRMTNSLGFNNSYAIGLRPATADSLGLVTISGLRAHPELRLGLTNEFMDRGDGWPSLRRRYGLAAGNARGLDHDLAYRALDAGEIDVMDVYTTDAEIAYYGIRILEDDLSFFQTYNAVFLFRADLQERAPGAVTALRRLEGALDEARISGMNARVKLDGADESVVAADFLLEELGIAVTAADVTFGSRLWLRTKEHLFLVVVSMTLGIMVAIPLGVVAFKMPRTGHAILGAVGVVQTIPALALLVFMIPILGIYAPPAIAALFLYSLLPMVRNTHAGLSGIAPSIEESVEALDLTRRARLFHVELPLASPAMMDGVKTATVINIGFATLGALIGAGGYGQPILTGIRLDDFGLILEGAVPAAVLALVAQGLFGITERFVVPKGLRIRRAA